MINYLVGYFEFNRWEIYCKNVSLQGAVLIYEEIKEDYDQVGVFKQKINWKECKPFRLRDNRNKSTWPISGLGGLISSLGSDWF